jgi:hypothetical protein
VLRRVGVARLVLGRFVVSVRVLALAVHLRCRLVGVIAALGLLGLAADDCELLPVRLRDRVVCGLGALRCPAACSGSLPIAASFSPCGWVVEWSAGSAGSAVRA